MLCKLNLFLTECLDVEVKHEYYAQAALLRSNQTSGAFEQELTIGLCSA